MNAAQKKKAAALKRFNAAKVKNKKEAIIRYEEIEERREQVKKRNIDEQKHAFLTRYEDAKRIDSADRKKKEIKEKEHIKHMNDLFRIDMENLEKKGQKQLEIQAAALKEEKLLSKELEKVETKLKRGEEANMKAVKDKRMYTRSFNVKVDETLNRVRSVETHLP